MRDAFGGAGMVNLIMIFLGIYVTFMAVSLNYARAFRVKNQIIAYIEEYEGYTDKVKSNLKNYLKNVNYTPPTENCNRPDSNFKLAEDAAPSGTYCVYSKKDGNTTYYFVETFIRLDFPFFGISYSLPIKGETMPIVKHNN